MLLTNTEFNQVCLSKTLKDAVKKFWIIVLNNTIPRNGTTLTICKEELSVWCREVGLISNDGAWHEVLIGDVSVRENFTTLFFLPFGETQGKGKSKIYLIYLEEVHEFLKTGVVPPYHDKVLGGASRDIDVRIDEAEKELLRLRAIKVRINKRKKTKT